MQIIVVGSNPGHKNMGHSMRNLYRWLDYLNVEVVSFTNVSLFKTFNNRVLHKNQYELDRLDDEVSSYNKIVALGNTASKALELINKDHFKLPHPSPRNRQLNNLQFINCKLDSCLKYIKGISK